MLDFMKKLFTPPVTKVDIAALGCYGTALSALEKVRERMGDSEDKTSVNQKIDVVRAKYTEKLTDMVKRGYVHDRFPQ
jgi:hypothetical protein